MPQFSTDHNDVALGITTLIDLIQDDPAPESRAAHLAEAAEEYNLNPAYLRRFFEANQGATVEAFIPPSREDEQAAKEAVAQAKLDRAMGVAEKWAREYNGRSSKFGKIFKEKGENYIFVVIQRNQPQWGLKAVRVSDASEFQFAHHTWDGILKQLQQ